MKISCADYSFPLLSHDHALELVSWLEVDGVDLGLMGDRSHLRPEWIREDVSGWAARVGEALKARELGVTDVFLIPWTDFETMAPNHPDAEERGRARQLFADTLRFAVALGAPGITLLPGIAWPGEEPSRSLERAADELSWRVARAADEGLRLSIEPHLHSLIEDPDRSAELVEMTPGLTLTLDPSHFVVRGIEQSAWQSLAPLAGHVHLRGATPTRIQAPMAASTIDLESFLAELRAAGYDGALALEYVWTDWEHCDETDNVSETLILRRALRQLLEPGVTGATTEAVR